MPSRNIVKIYVPGGIYHAYNRGVEKRNIFLDEQDYKVFLYYLKSYLLPPNSPEHKKLPYSLQYESSNFNLYNRINLFAYSLMPNHFHLLLKQMDDKAIIELMKRLSNGYTKYFNKKYDRVGPLFQGRYKAVLIDKENYFLHLSRYIHCNHLELSRGYQEDLANYSYSSYADYCGKKKTNWIYSKEILEYFKSQMLDNKEGFKTYKEFVESYSVQDKEFLGDLRLE